MKVHVNGEVLELPSDGTLADLLQVLELGGARVAVEVNETIIPRSQHSQQCLRDGDRVEVVHAIGGG